MPACAARLVAIRKAAGHRPSLDTSSPPPSPPWCSALLLGEPNALEVRAPTCPHAHHPAPHPSSPFSPSRRGFYNPLAGCAARGVRSSTASSEAAPHAFFWRCSRQSSSASIHLLSPSASAACRRGLPLPQPPPLAAPSSSLASRRADSAASGGAPKLKLRSASSSPPPPPPPPSPRRRSASFLRAAASSGTSSAAQISFILAAWASAWLWP